MMEINQSKARQFKVIVIAMLSFLLTFYIVKTEIGVHYETSDDPAMFFINKGYYAGQNSEEPRLIYQSSFLGEFFIQLRKVNRTIDWYAFLQLFALLSSFLCITRLFFNKAQNNSELIFFSLVALVAYFPSIVSFQFTKFRKQCYSQDSFPEETAEPESQICLYSCSLGS